jgi:CheY-like chemotaxis protein
MPPKPNVLVVEDEALIRLHLESILSELGCLVRIASDEEEAVAAIRLSSPDAAFLDLHLKSGTSEGIAALLKSRGVPLVLCSGSIGGSLPQVFEGPPIPPKPFGDEQVEAVLTEIGILGPGAPAVLTT